MKARLTLAALAAVVAVPALAQTPPPATLRPPPARAPAMALAVEAAETAVAACKAAGYTVSASVIDSAGVLRALVAAAGAGKGPVDSATRKANTSLMFKEASAVTQEKVKTDTALDAKIKADASLFARARAGAQPIMVGSEIIGAIGVGGAPGGEKDDACAIAGLDKVMARLR